MNTIEEGITPLSAKEWAALAMNMPLAHVPFGAVTCSTPEEAVITVGASVKSRATKGHMFGGIPIPEYHGRLLELSFDKTVVLSHQITHTPPFKWEGTAQEYNRLWECD